ncbi:MAG: glutamine-hydrolyzing GMP synthase [Myxococcota bacterium]
MARVPVLILDFGSQYTQLIARRIREQHVYCEIHPCTLPLAEVEALSPEAIVLSGGPSSVFEEGAPTMDAGVFGLGKPVLGICYGMQLFTHLLGGRVAAASEREYGPAKMNVDRPVAILESFAKDQAMDVWMSHGDRVEALPEGFEVLGHTASSPYAAVGDVARKIFGLQFHPEVAHTPRGAEVLRAFLFDVAGLEADWTAGSFVERSVDEIGRQVGDARAVCGLSGGVDSSVAALLVSRAMGDRLTCLFVDNGLLRKDEGQRVMEMFEGRFHLDIRRIDAQDEFLDALAGIGDPEKKRKIIGKVFIDVFEREAKKIDGVKHLVQGTLYPDVIESVSYKGPSAVIKSHHNVGGLPERMDLSLVEPLRLLFKDEVREVGQAMGIPRDLLWRQPFPGPGLAVRCPGAIDREKLDVLREADAVLEEEIMAAGYYDKLWQSFCVLVPVKTVGVMGDSRTYEWAIAIRAVESRDGMTADWARLPYELLAKASTRIINEVRGCNRVVYDITSKPPGTIEWE